MSAPFAAAFYGSTAWKAARKAYWQKRGGLCERCLAKGIIQPGEHVHHKIELTPANVNNPRIALSADNLELLCRACHEQTYGARRWRVDPDGVVDVRW